MARINIDDDLYSQSAWFELLIETKCPNKSLGALVRAWSVAQKFWFPNREPIPHETWRSEKLSDELIRAGFAMETDDGFYMTNNETRFQWLFDASEKGKKGGERSAASKKARQAQINQGEAQVEKLASNSTTENPPTLPPILPLTLSPDLNTNTGGECLDFFSAQEKTSEQISQGLKKARSKLDPDLVIDLFNQRLAGTGKLSYCHGLGSPSLRNMLDTFEKFPDLESWSNLFSKVKSTKKITGEESGVFLATLDWLSVKENALKVINGKYDFDPLAIKKKNQNNLSGLDLSSDEIETLEKAGEL